MTTSDERRKAAELMRTEAADFRRLGEEYDSAWDVDLGDVPAIFQDITNYVGLDGAVRVDTIFDRIADFIDPTCHMDAIDTGEQADYECREHIMHCSNCGAEFGYVLYGEDGDVSMDDKPKFCPECGHRTVDDGD